MKLIKEIIQRVVTILSLFGIDYRISPVVDAAPTEGSTNAVSSGGAFTALKDLRSTIATDKSDVPIQSSSKYFTAGGAYADKTDGCVTENTKNFTSGGARKYLEYVSSKLSILNWHYTPTTYVVRTFSFGNGLWVMGTSVNGLLYSINGLDWTQSNISSGWFNDVVYANGTWVAAGATPSGEAPYLFYSSDGKSWQHSSLPEMPTSSLTFTELCFGNGRWLVSTHGSGPIMSTDNARSWYKTSFNGWRWSGIGYGDGYYVIVSSKNPSEYVSSIQYSTDGNWQAGHWDDGSLIKDEFLEGIAYANGVWLAYPVNKGVIYSTDNGKTWSKSSLTSGYCTSACFARNVWVISCYNPSSSSTSGLWYSLNNGKTWARVYVGAVIYSVRYINGIFLAPTFGAGLLRCTNIGSRWIRVTTFTDAYAYNIVYGNNRYVCTGQPDSFGTTNLWYADPLVMPASLPD